MLLAAVLSALAATSAHTQAVNAGAKAPPAAKGQRTKVIVFYDATTMAIDETIIPDSDAEAATVFSSANHQVANAVRAEVDINDINTNGFTAAVARVAPGVVLTAPGAVSMLGDQVETMLAENVAREALR